LSKPVKCVNCKFFEMLVCAHSGSTKIATIHRECDLFESSEKAVAHEIKINLNEVSFEPIIKQPRARGRISNSLLQDKQYHGSDYNSE